MTLLRKGKVSKIVAGLLAVIVATTSVTGNVYATEIVEISSDEVIESEVFDLEDVETVTSEEENEAVLEEIVTESETYAADTGVIEIPGTISTEAEYDMSFNSVTGFASVSGNAVKDRTEYLNTDAHVKVKNGSEFAEAVLQAKSGNVKIIELIDDIDLGINKFSAAEKSKYTGFLKEYKAPSSNASIKNIAELKGFTNEEMLSSGVSSFKISDTDGLTIFSKKGYSISHAEINVNRNANDIVIRNIHFKDMWMWDDDGTQKAVGWSDLKLNEGRNIWIDHCTFDPAFDGNIDIENGATGISITWCKIGMTPEEATKEGNAIYNSIMTMEKLYSEGKITTGLYKKMRDAGATPEDVMMYSAYHDKCHLCGSGDKDCIDDGIYKNSNGNTRVTLAYNHYRSIGQRLPMIRQGSGHLINCYIDDSLRSEILNKQGIKTNATSNYKFSRCINARNGASIGADTCIFNGVEDPIIGAEYQKNDTGNMSAPWPTYFANAINHSLIVNSKVINSKGTYVGSSWDNNGVNNFVTSRFTWGDKSTIGKWAWSNTITNYNDNKKDDFGKITPYNFEFAYDYDEKLPYEYKKVSLDKVEDVVVNNSGICALDLSEKEWCQTSYIVPTAEEINSRVSSLGDVEYTGDFKNKLDEIVHDYEYLSETEKAKVEKLNTLVAEYDAIDNAVKLIDAIGTVEYTAECKNKIDAAKEAYNALSEDIKAKVTNKEKLETAEKKYSDITPRTVIFEACGGIVSEESKEVILGEAFGDLPVPVRRKYTFVGWFTDPYEGIEVKSTDIVDFDDTITLYAQWFKAVPEAPIFYAEIVGDCDFEYTSNPITPEIKVTFGDEELHEGIDYTVAYKNNVNAYEEEMFDEYGNKNANFNSSKAPAVIISGKGKYTSKVTAYFRIAKADISKVVDVTNGVGSREYVYYTKNIKVVKPVFVFNKAKLALNKDYKIELPDGVDLDKAESYEATIEAIEKSNFKGSATFTVKKVNIEKKLSGSINIPKYYYQGVDLRELVPWSIVDEINKGKLKAGGETLKKDDIELIMPTEMVEPGTYSVTIISNGQVEGVTGSITKTVTIVKPELGKLVSDYIRKGNSFKYILEDLSVSGNVYNPAGAEAILDTSNAIVSASVHEYDDEAEDYHDYEVTIADKGEFIEGRDYTVTYANNKKAGKASVTIKGKGNFAGIAGKYDYTIEKADLSGAKVVIPALTTYVNKGVGYKPSKVIVDVDGCTVKSTEYTVKYYLDDPNTEGARELGAKNPSTNKPYEFEMDEDKMCGILYAQITAKDVNYKGSIVKEYYVYRKSDVKTNLSTAIVKAYFVDDDGNPIIDCKTKKPFEAKTLPYTGKEITADTLEGVEVNPIKIIVTVKATKQEGTKKVTGNVDITDYVDIELTNNVNVGTATAVVSMKDGATGTVTLKDSTTGKEYDVDLNTVNGAKLQTMKIAPYKISTLYSSF